MNLKRYQCHKVVHAQPMTRGQWQAYKHNSSSNQAAKDDATPGYLVVYSKGTDVEYESWSPADVFDQGYSQID